MIIKSLELKNFRNYESLGIAFDAGTNILYGDNAQGKTNVLESLYVSGTTKSHKGSKDREMIRFDAEEAQTRSWESAVDIMAARIPQRNKPPIKIKTILPSKIC